MMRKVLFHELMRNTRQARFWIWCVTAIVLLALSAVNFADDLNLRRQSIRAVQSRYREALDSLESNAELRQIGLEMAKEADVSAWLTHGKEKRIPGAVHLNLIEGEVRSEHLREKNLLTRRVLHLDWVFVATFCLALAAALQGADLIAGESEEGTLKLVLANPLSRAKWLAGKVGGTLAALGLPALLGGAFSLLVLLLKDIRLDAASLALLGAAYVHTLLLLLVFLAASAWISCAFAGRTMALIGSLLVWLSLVLVLPGMARGAAELIQPAASPEEIEENIQNLRSNTAFATQEDMDQFVRDRSLMQAEFFQRLERQIALARWIEIVSPLAAFEAAADTLADSGWTRHRRFLAHVERQMQLLWEIAGESGNWQAYPDLSEVRPSARQRLLGSLRGAAILLTQAGLLLAGAFYSLGKMNIQ